jgi:hypothetical protein
VIFNSAGGAITVATYSHNDVTTLHIGSWALLELSGNSISFADAGFVPRAIDDESVLRSAIAGPFPTAVVSAESRVDPEEGWTRRVLVVSSGITDLDEQLAREEVFYWAVSADPRLSDALESISVLFE